MTARFEQDIDVQHVTPADGTPSETSLQAHGLRYLGRFTASRAHLTKVLRQGAERRARRFGWTLDMGLLDERIAAVIGKLTALGLLDDAAYATGRARSLARQGRSPRHIALALRQRGLGREEIATGVASLATEDEDPALTSARVMVRKRRLGFFRPEAERADWQARDMAKLVRAGFDYDTARRALAEDDEA